MPELKDIGGGFKTIDISGDKSPDVFNQVEKQYGLIDLVNRIQSAPLERKIKEIDAALKGNELLNIESANELQRLNVQKAKVDLDIGKFEAINKKIIQIRDAYAQDPNIGDYLLRQIPGAVSTRKESGATVVALPSGDAFTIATGDVTDPKELESIRNDRRNRWEKITKDYKEVYSQAAKIPTLLSQGTAQADISAIYAMAKMQDPGGRVTDGDYQSVQSAPNVSQYIKNQLTRALSQEGPILGGKGSVSRKNFLSAANIVASSAKKTTESEARSFHDGLIIPDKIDARRVMTTAGDISLESLFPDRYAAQKEDNVKTSQNTQLSPPAQVPSPIQAGFTQPQAGQNQGQEQVPQPSDLNSILNSWKKSTFNRGRKP